MGYRSSNTKTLLGKENSIIGFVQSTRRAFVLGKVSTVYI